MTLEDEDLIEVEEDGAKYNLAVTSITSTLGAILENLGEDATAPLVHALKSKNPEIR